MDSQCYAVEVPATSANLGPGFDCFGLAVQLYNRFSFRALPEDGKLELYSSAVSRQAANRNLTYSAYRQTLKLLGDSPEDPVPGIEICTANSIPSARGLGSSATAVVGGVLAAGLLGKHPLNMQLAVELSSRIEGHPDNVTPALLGGFTVCADEHTVKLEWPEELTIIVGMPELKVRTEASRRALPRKVTMQEAVFNLRRSALLVASLQTRDWLGVSLALQDRLHQSARASLIPGFSKVASACTRAGALGAVLSGSGPALLCVSLSEDTKAKDQIKLAITEEWKRHNVAVDVRELGVQQHPTKVRKIGYEEFEAERVKLQKIP